MAKKFALWFCVLAFAPFWAAAQAGGGLHVSGVSAGAKVKQENPEEIFERAKSGDAGAQLAIGSFYANGTNGFQKNPEEAVKWMTKSAEQGFQAAQLYLGVIYGGGTIVPRDFQKAQYWRELAAKNGSPQEKWSLGNAYFFGYMLPKNLDKAVFWIEAAANEGHPDAVVKMVQICEKLGDAENLSKWQNRLSELEIASAEGGNTAAMTSIAKKYLRGKGGLPKSISKGIFWYKKAADLGDDTALETLAKMYARGRYLPKNQDMARKYFMKLVDKNPSHAMIISNLYLQGKDGFPKDDEQSLFWLERAAERTDDSVRLYIAWRYWSGVNAPKDPQRAVYWCKQCKGNPSAEKMASDIMQNKAAPENFAGYLK